MNPFPPETGEWLAHEALEHAAGNTPAAIERMRDAVCALLLWQRLALFDAEPSFEEPRRG